MCALLTSQYKSIAATFPVPVLIATLPSERVIPPVDPLPPAVILFAVELPRPVTESRVSVFIAERSGGVYVKAPETLLYVKEPYEYLTKSIEEFVNQEELIDLMKENNFKKCSYRNLSSNKFWY